MENSERQKFDENWKAVFQDAEQQPSDRVWWSIDNTLTHAEGGTMKRKVVFYQRLAAASVIVALTLAGATTYFINESQQTVASTQPQPKSENGAKTENPAGRTDHTRTAVKESNTTTPIRTATQSDPGLKTKQAVQPPRVLQNASLVTADESAPFTSSTLRPNAAGFGLGARDPLADVYATTLHTRGNLREVTIVRKLPAMPASMMADSRRDKAAMKENLWAAVNASTGSYNSMTQGDRSQSFLMTSQSSSVNNLVSASSTARARGNAYSVGINMGTRLSARWVLQGGVSYMNQSQGYTSNFAAVGLDNAPVAIVSDYTAAKQTLSLSPTAPYDINSVRELVSVPLQAGYLLVNRRFGLQLNSGVATDLFIRNTLTDKSGQLNTFSESAGAESPYNTFSWAALGGTELSYKIGTQYRISLAPGFRYSLTPVLKSNSGNAQPLMWDLGFRFRYILR